MATRWYSVGVYGREAEREIGGFGADNDVRGSGGAAAAFSEGELEAFEVALSAAADRAGGLPSAPALLGGEALGLRVSVEAEGAMEALHRVVGLYREAAREALGRVPEMDEVEVVEQERFEAREAAAADVSGGAERPRFVGPYEVAEILGVRPQRVGQLENDRARGEREDFPAPLQHLRMGPVWSRDEIEVYARGNRRTTKGRRNKRVKNLKALRRARHLTQLQLEEKSGVGQHYISELENGREAGPDSVSKIATALGVDEKDLWGG